MAARAPTGPAPATIALLFVAMLSATRGPMYPVIYVLALCKYLGFLYRINEKACLDITLCMSFSKSSDKPLGR